MMRNSPKFSPEVQERAVRMVFDAKDQYPSQWAAIESIASKIGCTGETLRRWVCQGERDRGVRPGSTTAEQQRSLSMPWARMPHSRKASNSSLMKRGSSDPVLASYGR
jgi:transposase-like protein